MSLLGNVVPGAAAASPWEQTAMPAKNQDLHGMVPDVSDVALLLLDVINDLEWEGGELLLPHALSMARRLAALKKRCREARIPAIYVNDNYGRWQSDFARLIDHCLSEGTRGTPVVELLLPEEDDYFVLKPKHSGFFSTTLEVLLEYLQARTLIITGVAGDICVLFTANDAYMRDYNLSVPGDCVASNDPEDNRHALQQIATVLKADVTPSIELDLEAIKRRSAATCRPPAPQSQQ
jgi:nicotinamidase-related amidase